MTVARLTVTAVIATLQVLVLAASALAQVQADFTGHIDHVLV